MTRQITSYRTYIIIRYSNGNLVTEMDSFVMDFNNVQPGIQEGKEWIALLRYLQQFKPAEEGALPVIPDYYINPARSLVPVSNSK
jgi:hypothetical protein